MCPAGVMTMLWFATKNRATGAVRFDLINAWPMTLTRTKSFGGLQRRNTLLKWRYLIRFANTPIFCRVTVGFMQIH